MSRDQGEVAEPGSVSLTLADRIDRECDRFEAEWRAGRRPRVEDFLDGTAGVGRASLFRELLPIEMAWRRRAGERPGPNEYLGRFPEWGKIVRDAFGRPAGASPGPGTGDGYAMLLLALAVQNGLVARGALAETLNAWAGDRIRPIGDILAERCHLAVEDLTLLESLTDLQVGRHGGDPTRGLESMSLLGSLKEEIDRVCDPAHRAALRRAVAAHDDGDAVRIPDGTPGRRPDDIPGPRTPSTRRFRILRPHGRGDLCDEFVAHDEEVGREVALREIQEHQADDPRSRDRFLREARVTGRLEHPGIVPIYGLGRHADGRPYYATRLIEADSLEHEIRHFHADAHARHEPSGRSLQFRRLLGRFVDVCETIAYAHDRGVLHRDLKPSNVLLGRYGETLVVGWGLAATMEHLGTEGGIPCLTGPSTVGMAGVPIADPVGTPAYMSPEQAAGRGDLMGPASDVYSLGATLYALSTGVPPSGAEVVGDRRCAVQPDSFPAPRRLERSPVPALVAVCRRAMSLRPEDRYRSPREIADDVERWLADEPVRAYPGRWWSMLAWWGRRHRRLVAVAALALTLTVVLSIGIVLLTRARG